ncbi:MAG: circadian clock protein KaiC [Rhodomicrobium sp.]
MPSPLRKVSTGIKGLDEITGGGLPAGRASLICGGPGCGKTMLATSFLVEGARNGEPAVFLSFDESPADLDINSRSLGFDLAGLQARNLLSIDYIHIDRQEIHETGEYNLEGLFIRLGYAIDQIEARRVVLDGVDTLFAGLPNEALLRSELRRLFGWLKERGLSSIVTAERGDKSLTRHGIEEYLSDCVIVLEQRVREELTTRRLRVVKYRGSAHGANEYPYLIEDGGIKILPVTSLGLDHKVSSERISSGVAGLDALLEGKGFYKASSILISGGPGSGKTSMGAHFALAAAERGERCLYFAFEESEPQLVRNMRSIGIDLQPAIDSGKLSIVSVRPTAHGLEMHLTRMMHLVQDLNPRVAVVDPLTALEDGGSVAQASMMVLRLIDYLKSAGATALYLSVQDEDDKSNLSISSLMDSWITVRNLRKENGLERQLFIAKSRGMAHSADVRKLSIGAQGVQVSARKEPT